MLYCSYVYSLVYDFAQNNIFTATNTIDNRVRYIKRIESNENVIHNTNIVPCTHQTIKILRHLTAIICS